MENSLNRLTASEVMKTDVVTAAPDDSLQEAMALMIENHVTGLPILDNKSRCVGIISATDILRFEQDHSEETTTANANLARHFDPETSRWEDVRVTSFALEEFADIPVSELMTRDIISVRPRATIKTVAQKIVDEEVHRVLVLDSKQYLLGVISAVDFVQLVANSE